MKKLITSKENFIIANYRTKKEIEQDCKRLKEAAKTATTFKELEKATGLSYAMIQTTLSKHPTIFKRIKAQLVLNKEKATLETPEVPETAPIEVTTETSDLPEMVSTKQEENFSFFVIDASICGIQHLRNILSQISLNNGKIILTSITIKELEKLQKFDDVDGNDARYILGLAAENPNRFENVLIDENVGIPDDCIIKYCADHKDSVTLLTSDKTMALKARMFSVNVRYFNHFNSPMRTHTNSKIMTLIPAKQVRNELFISDFQRRFMSIRVFSNGLEYNEGNKKLKIGDDVLIVTKKLDYITFAHYRMISLRTINNCKLLYNKRFYNDDKIDVSNPLYKSFLQDFKCRHDL